MYYYNVSTSDNAYSNEPTHLLSVSRLLQNRPYWIKPFETFIKKKKTLIINAPVNKGSWRTWSLQKSKVAAGRLLALQQQGFNIYVCREHKLTELDIYTYCQYSSKLDFSIPDKTLIKQAIQQFELSHNELCVINAEALRILLEGEDDDWLGMTSFKMIDLHETNMSLSSLSRLLTKASTEVEVLNLSRCVNLKGEGLSDTLHLNHLRELMLGGEGDILIPGYSRPGCQSPRNNNLGFLSLQRLMKNAPNLEILDLSQCTVIRVIELNEHEQRFSYTLDDLSFIGVDSLNQLLSNCSHLKSINLSGCHLIGGDWRQLNIQSLPSLEILILKSVFLTIEDIHHILIKAKNLKTLDLSQIDENEMRATFDVRPLRDLGSLETLKLSKCSNMTILGPLLANANRLKKLDLSRCVLNEERYLGTLGELNLTSLEELNLSGANIHPTIIKKILAKTTKNIRIIGTKADYSPYVLPSPPKSTFSEIMSGIGSFFQGIGNRPGAAQSNQTAFRRTNRPKSLDADTTPNSKKELVVTKVFYASGWRPDPALSVYRLSIYNEVELNANQCEIGNAFTLKYQDVNLELQACNINQSKEDLRIKTASLPNQYYGKQIIHLTNEWQPLASLSPHESMTEYHLSHTVAVDIQYSMRDSLYYIRNKPGTPVSATPIHIDFLVNVPKSAIALPKDIQAMVKQCQRFQAKCLVLTKEAPTGNDYYEALKTQGVGACRHRSLVFKVWMKKAHPEIPVRIIENDCHSYIEVCWDKQWVTCDLGGYACKLKINEPHPEPKTKPKPEKQPEPPLVSSSNKVMCQLTELKRHYFKKTTQALSPSAMAYTEQLLTSEYQNTLITVRHHQDITGLRYHLQTYCKQTNQPCFYVHSPKDLICSAPYVERQGLVGTIKPGPGGPLHNFLKNHQHDQSQPLIIINYDEFNASDIVRFNTLLDNARKADGTSLPEDAKVIGLIHPEKPGAYDGADFYSRFDNRLPCLLQSQMLSVPSFIEEKCELTERSLVIDLYGGHYWEERLLGHWVLNGQNLHFVEGELINALKNNKTHIELRNAPWNDDAFQVFWQEAFLYGHIQSNRLPDGFKISQNSGYSFHDIAGRMTVNASNDIPADALAFNQNLLARFLGQYGCNKEQQSIHAIPGILSTFQGKILTLYVTDTLSCASWALFWDACQGIEKVNLILAPGVTLPDELGIQSPQKNAREIKPWISSIKATTAYINSSDIDTTLNQIQDSLVFDVSELEPTDLLMKLDGQFDKKTLCFKFNEQEGALLKALKGEKTIVLKGHFQENMRQILSDLLLQRQITQTNIPPLLLISDEPNLFSMLPAYTHAVTSIEKKIALHKQFPRVVGDLAQSFFERYGLAELGAMLRYKTIHPQGYVANAWRGMEILSLVKTKSTINLNDTETQAKQFNQQRLADIEAVLQHSPFVFLAGMTGVGKTSFVHHVWRTHHNALYIGENSLRDWATSASSGIKTLFIDEANISSRQWSEFEPLFNTPPEILIGNEYIKLTPQHKVIFAGNPIAYGGERQMPSLFKRHGNSVVFEPMLPAYIYQEILKPIFDGTSFKGKELAKAILAVSQFLTNCSQENVLLSPRELAMMALLTVRYCQDNPEIIPETVAKYYAYTLSKAFVPDDFKANFEAQFKVADLPQPHLSLPKDFLVTQTNLPALVAINDRLKLRDLRRNKPGNNIQQYGGLGGVIIEGVPGIGKTELVIKTLLAHGLKQGELHKDNGGENLFYVMPVSMSLSEKEALLHKAFNENAVVVIDEINSAPMMERLLNELLNQGLTVFGTQNPVSMAGRARASFALQHRVQKIIIADYTPVEMMDILIYKGLSKAISQAMIFEYLAINKKSLSDTSISSLCFRDLLKRAEHEIIAIHQAPQDEAPEVDSNAETHAPPSPHLDPLAVENLVAMKKMTEAKKIITDALQRYLNSRIESSKPRCATWTTFFFRNVNLTIKKADRVISLIGSINDASDTVALKTLLQTMKDENDTMEKSKIFQLPFTKSGLEFTLSNTIRNLGS